MSCYFFHIFDDLITTDDEGIELPNLDAARAGAVRAARALMCETLMNGRLALGHRIDIADANGTVLDTVHFRDLVQIEG